MLKKEYKYVPSKAVADEEPDAEGLTPSALEFSWEQDVKPSVSFHLFQASIVYLLTQPFVDPCDTVNQD